MPYDVTVIDPSTGSVKKRGKIKGESLSEGQLSQLKQATAQQFGVNPNTITIAPEGAEPAPITMPAPQPSPYFPELHGETESFGERMMGGIEAVPYFGLGFVPEVSVPAKAAQYGMKWLAEHPQVVSGTVKSILAGGIGAGESALKGQDPQTGGLTSGVIQAGLEALTRGFLPLWYRAGSEGIRRVEDETAASLMSDIKGVVPWFEELPDSHAGINAIAQTGDAAQILTRKYGEMLQSVKSQLPDGASTLISMNDAVRLGLASGGYEDLLKMGVKPELLGFTKGVTGEVMSPVPTASLIEKVSGLGKTDPALSRRMIGALDESLPQLANEEFLAARQQYREGINFVKAMESGHVIDQQSGRLNVERLFKSLRSRYGPQGEPGTSILEQTRAPGASGILKKAVPPNVQAPGTIGFPRFFGTSGGHVGIHAGEEGAATAALAKGQPKRIFYSDVPLTPKQQAAREGRAATIHAGAKALGVTPED